MKSVCAWCGAGMKDNGIADGLISHGICPPCAEIMIAEMEKADAANTRLNTENTERSLYL